jgi:membrane protease subunit (stomatin/prohibitin family)
MEKEEIISLIKGAIKEAKAQDRSTEEKDSNTDEEFECGECGARFTHKAKFCPECGVELEEV